MILSIIVPVFNEEKAVPLFYRALREMNTAETKSAEIIFVNDGSRDGTRDVIAALAIADPLVRLVNFSRNFGKEAALLAGLEHSRGEAVIPIDVDLQDPVEVIPLLVEKWRLGADVVLAKRVDRSSDSLLKRKSAEWFYGIHNMLSQVKIEPNVGDFRLMSRTTVNNIVKLSERNLFMKGLLSWVGGRVEIVEYKRAARIAGETKFNAWKLWNLALEGITSFSTVPLRIWTYLGVAVSAVSFFYAVWMIIDKLAYGNDVRGYPSLLVTVLFLGGVQLIGIGVVGEYIGRIYIEAKARPRYIVSDRLND